MGRVVPLPFLREGTTVMVREIIGGRRVLTRLFEMGLIPNTMVRIVRVMPHGPLLIEVRGSKVALGRGIAMKVMVEER